MNDIGRNISSNPFNNGYTQTDSLGPYVQIGPVGLSVMFDGFAFEASIFSQGALPTTAAGSVDLFTLGVDFGHLTTKIFSDPFGAFTYDAFTNLAVGAAVPSGVPGPTGGALELR